eukprot:15403652-Alexandrium_andersonii.AAC.1
MRVAHCSSRRDGLISHLCTGKVATARDAHVAVHPFVEAAGVFLGYAASDPPTDPIASLRA